MVTARASMTIPPVPSVDRAGMMQIKLQNRPARADHLRMGQVILGAAWHEWHNYDQHKRAVALQRIAHGRDPGQDISDEVTDMLHIFLADGWEECAARWMLMDEDAQLAVLDAAFADKISDTAWAHLRSVGLLHQTLPPAERRWPPLLRDFCLWVAARHRALALPQRMTT